MDRQWFRRFAVVRDRMVEVVVRFRFEGTPDLTIVDFPGTTAHIQRDNERQR